MEKMGFEDEMIAVLSVLEFCSTLGAATGRVIGVGMGGRRNTIDS
jgi:hypothetical protein